MFPGDLENLVEPVAAGTSDEPIYDGDTVHMTVEYRSDLNGGLDHGFWIREFGVFAQDEDGSEVMLYYGALGDYPQWVSAYSTTGLDVRRYPISITVGEGAEVIIDYSPEAFMTSRDVKDLLAVHNADPGAHGIQRRVIAVRSRDPNKPAYGLGGEVAAVLSVGPYTGTAPYSAVVSGTEYDALNISVNGDTAPDGTIILSKTEE